MKTVKKCPVCKIVYTTATWSELPLINRLRENSLLEPTPDDADLGDWVEIRACPCGLALTAVTALAKTTGDG